MDANRRLQRDHEVLHSKLRVLESALRAGLQAWYVLREECFSLAKRLEDHIRREQELQFAVLPLLNSAQPHGALVDHAVEGRLLAGINRFLITHPNALLERIAPAIARFISILRGRMDQQGSLVFPTAADTVTHVGADRLPTARRLPWNLSETMTVGEVVTRYPAVEPVLERLFISQAFERYDCLDEVAWRHGMESRVLFAQLEEALARQRAPEMPSVRGALGAACCGGPHERRSPILVPA